MMFRRKNKNRYLALSVALALGGTMGGAVCGSVVEAADVIIDPMHPPTPFLAHDGGPGVAAGIATGDEELSGHKLTIDTVTFNGTAYSAYTAFNGNVKNNTLIL